MGSNLNLNPQGLSGSRQDWFQAATRALILSVIVWQFATILLTHIFCSAMVLLMNGAPHPIRSIHGTGSLQVMAEKPGYILKQRKSPQEMLFIYALLLSLKIPFPCFANTSQHLSHGRMIIINILVRKKKFLCHILILCNLHLIMLEIHIQIFFPHAWTSAFRYLL